MKEAESLIGLLKGDQVKNNARMMCTDHLRHRTLFIMSELCDECSDVVEPTVYDLVTYYSCHCTHISRLS
jgi:hypothetical protein